MDDEMESSKPNEWLETTRKEAMDFLVAELDQMLKEVNDASAKDRWAKHFAGFKDLFSRFLRFKPTVEWAKIKSLPPEALRSSSGLKDPTEEEIPKLLEKVVVLRLNGGLGTSMGCKGPKSLIAVHSDMTFLDMTIQQTQYLNDKYGVDLPLILMNSFNTDDDTKRALRKYRNVNVSINTFAQSCYPRINKETLLPITRTANKMEPDAWYPPGHGDLYKSFYESGLLDSMLSKGKEYCFVSNIDNLGATLDPKIIKAVIENNFDYVMELTDKTRADVKGGTLISYEGQVRLLELPQVPKENRDEFFSVSKFKYFNTNNLWIKLSAIKKLVSNLDTMDMEIIVNPKTLENGTQVLQLETAAGSAVKNFKNSIGLVVPRSRFLPVKKTQDLLLIMSNLYVMSHGFLTVSPKRHFSPVPLIKLGSSFDKVSLFLKRFQNIPDLMECDHLTVSGDVWFGKNVKLRGTVIIIANHGERIDIPPGSVLANKIVSGNLRILDH